MKIVIANSKKWFSLDQDIHLEHSVITIANSDRLTKENLDKIRPDLIFFTHWSWIVPKEIFASYKCIVFHTAPLPFGRGGSPIQNLIISGYEQTPVCALRMEEGVDAGPIYIKKEISLDGPLWKIFQRLNVCVNQMIKELVKSLPEPKKQDGEVYYFKRLKRSDNAIHNNLSIKEIYDRIRMVDEPSYPSAFLEYGNIVLEFSEAKMDRNEIFCKVKIKSLGTQSD
tara:strand:- start:19 stop:696 length:678 start_codon:yes stop_codon:yes gene_type:complete